MITKRFYHVLARLSCAAIAVAGLTACTDNTAFHDLNDRITKLEQSDLSKLNEKIDLLEHLISVAEGLDYITNIEQQQDGTWIMHLKSQPDVPIIIGSGTIGQPGADGTAVSISARKVEGVWYWVINGQLTNVRASGTDGRDGDENSVDPHTIPIPYVKVSETGYWVYSDDNGLTWKPIKNPDGEPVYANGKDSASDPVFQSVTLSANGETVEFVLLDGTVIVVDVQQ